MTSLTDCLCITHVYALLKPSSDEKTFEKHQKTQKIIKKSVSVALENPLNIVPDLRELLRTKKNSRGHPCQVAVVISPSSDVAEKKTGYLGVAPESVLSRKNILKTIRKVFPTENPMTKKNRFRKISELSFWMDSLANQQHF